MEGSHTSEKGVTLRRRPLQRLGGDLSKYKVIRFKYLGKAANLCYLLLKLQDTFKDPGVIKQSIKIEGLSLNKTPHLLSLFFRLSDYFG